MTVTKVLRNLIASGTFLHLPSVYDPLSARQVQQAGFEATYVGGYVSGAIKTISEPLLTLTEQVNIASEVAKSVSIDSGRKIHHELDKTQYHKRL